MKQSLLLLAAFALSATTATAQIPLDKKGKMDVQLRHIARKGADARSVRGLAGKSQVADDGTTSVILRTDNPERLIADLQAKGIRARVFGKNGVSALVPAAQLADVEACSGVKQMRLPAQYELHMDSTRAATGADKLHNGVELETPFTGKGVLVGVIDSGIDPGHPAFYDENQKTRVKRYWNNQIKDSAPTSKIPMAGQGDGDTSAGGHGTHVANITAGGYKNNGLYGMAPGADLYLVSTTLQDENIFYSMLAIAEYADSVGQPYVVNMSFGSNMGPHDGTSALAMSLDQFVGEGAFICSSMGNDRGALTHTSARFDAANESKCVIFAEGRDKIAYAGIYSSSTDSLAHFNVRPFFYGTPRTGLTPQKIYISSEDWDAWDFCDAAHYIDPYNGRQTFEFYISADDLRAKLLDMYRSQGYKFADAKIGFELTSLQAGTSVHVWTENGYGTIATPSETLGATWMQGDDLYDVGEGPACAEHSVAVASWNASNSFESVDGNTYTFSNNPIGAISAFSSRGPWLGTDPKPTVAAPGLGIKSAFYTTSYSNTQYIVDQFSTRLPGSFIRSNISYGVMSGTSMSSPAVTGAVALWLEACPSLTYDQLMEIFRTTSVRDSFTGEQWNVDFGYGKLDAYAGLKKALEMANRNGINEVQNTLSPLSILKSADAWRLLFNSDESFARIDVYTVSGCRVTTRTLSNVRRGHEETLSLTGLTPGAYVVNITTPRTTTSRKVMVH